MLSPGDRPHPPVPGSLSNWEDTCIEPTGPESYDGPPVPMMRWARGRGEKQLRHRRHENCQSRVVSGCDHIIDAIPFAMVGAAADWPAHRASTGRLVAGTWLAALSAATVPLRSRRAGGSEYISYFSITGHPRCLYLAGTGRWLFFFFSRRRRKGFHRRGVDESQPGMAQA